MDDLFKVRVLTAAINSLRPAGKKIFQRLFAGKEHMEPSDRIAFDIISGSEGILKNISVNAAAIVTKKTGRKTITITAPRLSHKRFISTAELNAMRTYGGQFQAEQMKSRIKREQLDMRNMDDRTLEYWACRCLSGQIMDSDGSTVLVDFNMAAAHKPTLAGGDLWTDVTNSNPVSKIRGWKKLIGDDHGGEITEWVAFHGSAVGDTLIEHNKVRDLLKYDAGRQIAESGRITKLADVELIEYDGSYVDTSGTRQRFIPDNVFVLIGLGPDVFDLPFAPVVDDDAPGGVGNTVDGKGVLFFSKSWKEEDPSGRWIKSECRPLPVLQRPGAVVYGTAV